MLQDFFCVYEYESASFYLKFACLQIHNELRNLYKARHKVSQEMKALWKHKFHSTIDLSPAWYDSTINISYTIPLRVLSSVKNLRGVFH